MKISAVDTFTLRVPTIKPIALDFPEHRLVVALIHTDSGLDGLGYTLVFGGVGSEAVEAYTLGSAFAAFQEKDLGSITPGKLADFVVLAKDPHKVEPDRIKDIEVIRTVIGGQTVHPRQG